MNSIKLEALQKPCPRCGNRFECGAAIHQCACFTIKLSLKTKEFIRENYDDCLCISCLNELNLQNPE
ncbi:cysteine-rich CWC family protein [Leptospira stimsonii]|uniref:Cysteine-rich CWC n=1 Tax=Leptospira stimsonii TaxID=2202203 RepID=A0A4R9L4N6_9LEPT|nr:cysteine-rich CWC family protein [Leptospira stimsonii]RHX88065.1 hypothetical protein DLM78_03635 [Leptospira stimsonii]TGK23775.1 hypothetical protein EHO98_03685 [Leptospira stimsonii]TGM10517.1 hypothetical protein EHQ90_18835 [Leptospira stimsonii]